MADQHRQEHGESRDATSVERVYEQREDDERAIACPFCHSTDVELLSLFGSQLSTDQWYCRNCHTPFERFRRDDE
jgi:ribosomal protein L37AE/L43A